MYQNKIIKYYTDGLIITRWWPMVNKNDFNTKNNDHVFQSSTKISKHVFDNKV